MKKGVAIALLPLIILVCSLFSFEIVNAQSRDDIISGEIDYYTFSRSIPEHMTIGDSYKVLVFVKNTGKSPANFLVVLTTPGEFIYPRHSNRVIALDGGESCRIEFLITPVKPNIGELNITSKLYLLAPLLTKIDSKSDSVFLIKRGFSIGDIVTVIISILIIICGIAVIMRMLKIF